MSDFLVTVGIATFNSAKFIEETLESVKAQTYPFIELVVSDDCSKDNTLEVVNNWLQHPDNASVFKSYKLVKVSENQGVSANCNRIFSAASGDFVKLLAGDDILLPNCLELNVNFVKSNPLTEVVFSQVGIFRDNYIANQFTEVKPKSIPLNLMNPDFDAKKQFSCLLISDLITYTPSVFFKRETILRIGGFDEEFRLIEDYPMWLKLTGSGVKLNYFNQLTIGYRRHSASINNIFDSCIFAPSIINSYPIRVKYVFPHLGLIKKNSEKYEHLVVKLFLKYRLNNKKYRFLFYFLSRHTNPFWLLNRLLN